MKLVTAQEMAKLDRLASEKMGIPSIVLMENAGLRVVEAISSRFKGKFENKKVLIIVGKGNNGGDGLVIARHLKNRGVQVKVFLMAGTEAIKGDSKINLNIWRQMGGKIYSLKEEKDLQRLDISLIYCDLVIDAIYGTGFKGAIMGFPASVVTLLAESGKPIISVDLPSGMEANTGKVHGPCVRAEETISFCLPKIGLFLEPGASFAGKVQVADISIPGNLIAAQKFKRNLITWEWVKSKLPTRPAAGHKGTFGNVLVVGGARGMTGAVVLASEAVLRTGAGMVTAAVPTSLNTILEQKTTEVITAALPETAEQSLSDEGLEQLLEYAEGKQVVALGPGLSRHPSSSALVQQLLNKLQVPLVLDADGINALEGGIEILASVKTPVVITPHPGEMARLLGVTVKEVQSNRIETAESTARQTGKIVVLKGSSTVVAAPGGASYINPTGNTGMGTAGSGDVLTGIIASLIAQGLKPEEAAAAGVYLHGACGDYVKKEKGERGLVAGDLVSALPLVLGRLDESESTTF